MPASRTTPPFPWTRIASRLLWRLSPRSRDIDNFVNSSLAPLLLDTTANRAQIITQVDSYLAQGVALLERAASLTLPSSGWGFIYAWLHQAFVDLLAQIGELVARWTQKLTDFNNALTAYDALPAATNDANRFAALQAAELTVSAALDPLPATPALMRSALPAKATALQNRLAQFQAIQNENGQHLRQCLLRDHGTHDGRVRFSAIRRFFHRRSGNHDYSGYLARSDKSIVRCQDAHSHSQRKPHQAASATSATDQVTALIAAGKALMGDDFQIIPEFTVSAAQGAEWANAIKASNSGDLFTYLKTTLNIDFPVDEWFYATARVREPLRSWESALMLASAFGLNPPTLTPIQLPFSAGEPWLRAAVP